ncbi:unnamed protein product, partial [Urochloa humidicola]
LILPLSLVADGAGPERRVRPVAGSSGRVREAAYRRGQAGRRGAGREAGASCTCGSMHPAW